MANMNLLKSFLQPIGLISLIIFSSSIFSQSKKESKNHNGTAILSLVYHFYDGKDARSILLEPELLAEFGNGNIGKSLAQRSKIMIENEGIKIWNISGSEISKQLSGNNLKSLQSLSSRTSPVFSENGRLQALPGGLIVELKPNTNFPVWLQSKGFKSGQSMGVPNFYFIPTEPGIVSLEIANGLHEDPYVSSATPNWWMESEAK